MVKNAGALQRSLDKRQVENAATMFATHAKSALNHAGNNGDTLGALEQFVGNAFVWRVDNLFDVAAELLRRSWTSVLV